MQQPDLRGKTALVTGGGRGIGRAAALQLAGSGANVIVTARTREQINDTVREIQAGGGRARAIPADIGNDGDVRRLMRESGEVDILVNNAGIIDPIAPVLSASPDAWRRDIEVNLYGVFLTCHYVLPGMLSAGWGRIVNISSGAARGTTIGWSAYSAAKAGVEALTGVLAREVGDRGVHVNALRPGIVDTEMQVEIRGSSDENFGPENVARFRRYKEQGQLRKPEDPARLILWLLSPEADGTNGEVLAIDDPEVAARVGLTPIGR